MGAAMAALSVHVIAVLMSSPLLTRMHFHSMKSGISTLDASRTRRTGTYFLKALLLRQVSSFFTLGVEPLEY
ncbi:hypothetical protein CPB85DRAFT_1281029 [Mucidula mucida]|nr:hypothetical protein CPB85DRAFT_1281029 [Mucidula mucida]